MALLLARIGGFRFLRYALASGGALVVDIVCFTALLALEIPGMLAATIGYAAGILVHWFLSSRQVFTGTVAPAQSLRRSRRPRRFGDAPARSRHRRML